MSYYLELDSHIRNKGKLLLDLSNYATKNLNDATGIDTPNFAAKRDFLL